MKQAPESFRILLLILMTWILGCSQSTAPGPDAAQSFLPLAVGNRWIYNGSPDKNLDIREIWTVTSMRIISGYPCYTIRMQYTHSDIVNEERFHLDGKRIYVSNDASGNMKLLADFGLEPGETASHKVDGFRTCITLISRTADMCVFVSDAPQIADDETEITFMRGVGITARRSLAWGNGIALLDYRLVFE
ncbi:hypothetical protein JW948_17310 [bacterium]|nr:hypothetical protein [bacterium]